ncbi:DUF1496 domain-containing protein [Vibrio mimicus]
MHVGDVYLTCQQANDFKTKGPLKWLQLNQNTTKTRL